MQPLSDVFAATPNGSTNLASNQLSRMKSPLPQTQMSKANLLFAKSPSPKRNVPSPKPVVPVQDSGYYGSQEINLADEVLNAERNESHSLAQAILLSTTTTVPLRQSLSRTAILDSPEKTFQTARENQTTRILIGETVKNAFEAQSEEHLLPENAENHVSERPDTLPTNSSPKSPVLEAQPDENSDDIRSPSEASSPIRPLVRKSSLNFASLPAREPLTAGKSLGGRISRTSHLDNGNNRTSYYHRAADGKSTGNAGKYDMVYDDNQDAMDVDGDILDHESPESAKVAQSHTKTYTQRLHDQISMLGKSQASNGSSKATSGHFTVQQTTDIVDPAVTPKRISPKKSPIKTTPGAFPQEDDDEDDEDDEDEWIEPPTATGENTDPRPILPKSYSADVMEGIHNKNTIGQIDLPVPKRLDRAPINNFGFPSVPIHAKSASVSTMPSAVSSSGMEAPRLMKTISVPNPGLEPVGEMDGPATPSKSPSRSFRDSPLKQVKNKLSSILKSSRGLLASSAAISAEGKSMLSPSATRLGLHLGGSSESIIPKGNLSSHNLELKNDGEETSSAKPGVRRTRASVEREKEEKRREKEAKRMAEQMDKLDRAREKEREKARVFSKEQEKMAVLEREIASKRHDESQMPQETPHPTRSSPRKAQVAEDVSARQSEDDVDMIDAQPSMPSASGSRSAGPSHIVRNKDIKRPVKPTKEAQTKTRQAPTVIRVNTGSQHSQYHTATTTSRVSTAAQDMIVPSNSQPQHQLSSKASLQTKPSAQSLKNLASAGRSKAMELAAKKKELEEREAQRRRETKADMERKRVIAQEEQRKQEQQRRLETERQKQKDREQVASQTEEKKSAQRQAAIEKAKQTRAPPPPTRSQPNGPPDTTSLQYKQVSTLSSQKADSQPNRPPSRMMSGIRSQDEPGRPVSVVLSSTAKTGTKRTLGADMVGDGQNQRPQSKAGPSYQAKDAKRRRTSENFDDELDMNHPPNIKGPPVRPSGGFKKVGAHPRRSLLCLFGSIMLTDAVGLTRQICFPKRIYKCTSERYS